MKSRQNSKLFLLAALVVAFALLLTTNTAALAQRPVPQNPQDRIELGSRPSADPNAPANLAKIVASDAPVRVIVQLDNAPIAQYKGGLNGLAPTAITVEGERLNTAAAPAQAYGAFLSQQQDKVAATIQARFPSTQVQYKYQVAFNGFTAKVPGSAIPAIKALAGVREVTVERPYQLDMDASLQLIGLYNGDEPTGTDQGLWKQVGGHANAGKGVKIADIDSGIDQTNPFFNPKGFVYPPGFPKGNTKYTTPKVIAARAYFRPDDPPDPAVSCACPQDSSGHGSHTAGTMAGVFGTDTPFNAKISGIAPKAWLMNYRVFYRSSSGSDSAYDPELLAALEDVIKDGADVVNNSWGGTALNYATDPLTQAYQAATDTGLVVVFSAGNNGPSTNSIGTPGAGEKVITVGASTTNRVFYHAVSVVGGDPTVTDLFGAISSGPWFSTDVGPAEYADALSVGNELGCNAFAAGSLTGKIALIKRGTCTFAVKVGNAEAAGAIGTIVWNHTPGADPIAMGVLEATTKPSVMVSYEGGLAMRAWLNAHPGAQVVIKGPLSKSINNAKQDQIASFSSKGPNSSYAIKPDLTAPGVNILSAYVDTFELLQGTSMAAPHVTGVAALLHQLHPKWTPAMYKSALVNTAEQPASLDATCKDAIGGLVPGPQCRGAGRLNAKTPGGAGDPGIVFDTPSISLRTVYPGSTVKFTVTAKNIKAAAQTYDLSVDPQVTDANIGVALSTGSLVLPGSQKASFDVTFTVGGATPQGDYYGQINAVGSGGKHKLHIEYWMRVLPPFNQTTTNLLLIDDDSSNTRGFADYRTQYTNALTALGVAYDVLETDTVSTCAAPWDIASRYQKAIMFTGDSRGFLYYCDFGIGNGQSISNYTGANNYFANGAHLLVTGQNFAYGLAVGDARDSDLKLYFGAHYVQSSVWGSNPAPSPSAQGNADWNPFLLDSLTGRGLKVDFSPTSGGAANQNSVDGLDAMNYSDADAAPLFNALNANPTGSGVLGTRMSVEPTLERTRTKTRPADMNAIAYRTALLSFGLEAVSDAQRQTLLAAFIKWLDDEVKIVSAAPVAAKVKVGAQAKLSVSASSSAGGSITFYRVDWGDGSDPFITSNANSIWHGYVRPGIYKVRIEVMDSFGHKAVSTLTKAITVVP